MKKKYLVGGLLMSAAALSHAQSNVTIYGIVDSGVEYISNQAAGGAKFRIPSTTGTFASRLGFRGTEDLGGGMNAVFTLENGFDPGTGTANQGGRLMGRQAFVGLTSKDWGQVTVGRQWTMTFWGMLDSDILGSNIFGMGSLDSYFPNAREDNSIAYRGTFSGFSVGATYSLGRDAVATATPSPPANNCAGENSADAQACRAWSAMIKYDTASWGLSAVIDRLNGGAAAPVYGGLVGSNKHDTRSSLNGWVKFDALKLGGGVVVRHNDGTPTTVTLVGNPTGLHSNLYYLEAAYAVSPAVVIDGGWFRTQFKDYSGGNSNLFALRATYNASKRTALYATAGYVNNGDNVTVSVDGGNGPSPVPPRGESQTGVMLGIRHNF